MSRPIRSEDGDGHDRLTRLCGAMASALEDHPEYREGDKAILMVDDFECGGLVAHGYDEGSDMEVAHRLLSHARAIHEVHGIPFTVAVVPRGNG